MKFLLATTALTFIAHAALAAPPFTLGMMNGGQDYASSITELQQFEAASGVTPLVAPRHDLYSATLLRSTFGGAGLAAW